MTKYFVVFGIWWFTLLGMAGAVESSASKNTDQGPGNSSPADHKLGYLRDHNIFQLKKIIDAQIKESIADSPDFNAVKKIKHSIEETWGHLEREEPAKAIYLLNQIMMKDVNDKDLEVSLLLLRARIYEFSNLYLSNRDINFVLQLQPQLVYALYKKGKNFAYWKHYHKAAKVLSDAVAVMEKPDLPSMFYNKVEEEFELKLHFNRAQVYYLKGQYKQAIQETYMAIRFISHSSDLRFVSLLWSQLGRLHFIQKDNRALKVINKAIQLDPKNTEALIIRGRLLSLPQSVKNVREKSYKSEQYRIEHQYTLDAMENFTQALKLDPQNVEALVFRGRIFYWWGNYDKAERDFKLAIKLGIETKPEYLMIILGTSVHRTVRQYTANVQKQCQRIFSKVKSKIK